MQNTKGSWTKVGAMTALLCVSVGLTYGFLPPWFRYPWIEYYDFEGRHGFRFPIIARVSSLFLWLQRPLFTLDDKDKPSRHPWLNITGDFGDP